MKKKDAPMKIDLTHNNEQVRVVELHKFAKEMVNEREFVIAAAIIKRGFTVAIRAFKQDREENSWLITWMLGCLVGFLCASGRNSDGIKVQSFEFRFQKMTQMETQFDGASRQMSAIEL